MNPRACWVFQGDTEWCHTVVTKLLSRYTKKKIVWIAATQHAKFTTLAPKQAQTLLGQETDVIVFDAISDCNPDALGAVSGSIRAGGALIILLSDEEIPSLWQQRFEATLSSASTWVKPGDKLPKLAIKTSPPSKATARYRTEDQRKAVTAIENVALGHRRRPLVLTSDRGRGKSAALGIAAAHLLRAGKQRIVVTGPSLVSVMTVFKHAASMLPSATVTHGCVSWENARLEFIAPDALITEKKVVELLLVDEAAAIPSPMLAVYIKRFSRVVFSTTLHGYEGSGRGFAIRFQQLLAKECPNYQQHRLVEPVRWLVDDPIEKLMFNALLLNANPAAVDDASKITLEMCKIRHINRKALLADSTVLRQLFGLMVSAHYRTRPSDLKILLDHPGISVWIISYQDKIIAGAWSIEEGRLESQLAHDIHAGKRRVKGHLLPQTLINHAGDMMAAELRYQRVMRIAVLPELQSRGFGAALLYTMAEAYQKQGIDMLGASFGGDVPLINFWRKAGFSPVRLGTKQNDSSGYRSIVMLHSLSQKSYAVLKQAEKRFEQQWPYLLGSLFQQMPTELVLAISAQHTANNNIISTYEQQDVAAFAYAQRDFDSSRYALSLWMPCVMSKLRQMPLEQSQPLVMAILQGRSWQELSQALNVKGKADVLVLLRESVGLLLD